MSKGPALRAAARYATVLFGGGTVACGCRNDIEPITVPINRSQSQSVFRPQLELGTNPRHMGVEGSRNGVRRLPPDNAANVFARQNASDLLKHEQRKIELTAREFDRYASQ